MRREPTVVLSTFGDGATSEGEWHESVSFAEVHRLPVAFLCENNRYAISVPPSSQTAAESIARRASAYGFAGVTVDGQARVREELDRATDEAEDAPYPDASTLHAHLYGNQEG